jgi:predicted DNA-binding protein
MLDTEINLTEQERNALQEISRRTGKTEGELVREALDQFIAQFQSEDQRRLMQQAKGIWKDRQDLPSLQDLRNEWDRI